MKETENKSLKAIKGSIYRRTLIIVVLVLLQGAIYVGLSLLLRQYSVIANIILTVFGILVAIFIVSTKSDAYYKLSWVILIAISPMIGSIFYLFIHNQRSPKRLHNRISRNARATYQYLPQDETLEKFDDNNSFYSLARYAYTSSNYPAYHNCDLEFYPLGDDYFPAIMREMEKAERFIFIETFIISFGKMWSDVLELLKKKADEGVEVRLLYDGFNTFTNLPTSYKDEIESYGIKCHVFSPMVPLISNTQNYRDHRKILVVDGKVAFTGGNNLADEYINVVNRFGHWKDTSIMVRGEAVKSFTMMFLRMWNSKKREDVDFEKYIFTGDFEIRDGSGYVIPYGYCPLSKEQIGEYVYLHILYNAKKYVHITTPYLVINDNIQTALIHAAKRGVDVKLLLPRIPDKGYAFCVARSFYPELLESGVKIFEYTPGFVHAKEFICDDEICTVGTVNLDFRSLFLHFECGLIVYNNKTVREVEADFQEYIDKSQEIDMEFYKSLSFAYRYAGKALRVAGPLL